MTERQKKIKELQAQIDAGNQKVDQIWEEGRDVQAERNVLIAEEIKEQGWLSQMHWSYQPAHSPYPPVYSSIEANESWDECPRELIDLLSPDYHWSFDIDKDRNIELQFSDGLICLQYKDVANFHDFCKDWNIIVDLSPIREMIEKTKKDLKSFHKILKLMQSGKQLTKDEE